MYGAQSRAQQQHTAKEIAAPIIENCQNEAVLAAQLLLLPPLAATDCAATVCCHVIAAVALRLTLPPQALLSCRCYSYAVFVFVGLFLFAVLPRSPA